MTIGECAVEAKPMSSGKSPFIWQAKQAAPIQPFSIRRPADKLMYDQDISGPCLCYHTAASLGH
jgi:hypothetical protein